MNILDSFFLNLVILLYKIVDRGIFEILGPNGLSFVASKKALNLYKLQTGYLYHYTFIILITSTMLLGSRKFWLIFENLIDFRIFIIFFVSTFFIVNFKKQ